MQALDEGFFDTAIAHFTDAIHAHPEYADAYYRRASARLKRVLADEVSAEVQEVEAAVADLTRAVAILPLHFEASYNRGLALAGLGRFREAAQDFQHCLQTPDVNLRRDAHAKLATILDEKFVDMEPQAIRHYEKYVELGGTEGKIRERLAALLDRHREPPGGKKGEKQPPAQTFRDTLIEATAAAEKGDRARAVQMLEKALESKAIPESDREVAALLLLRWRKEIDAESQAAALLKAARVLLREGKREMAVELLTHAAARYSATRVVSEEILPFLKELKK